MSRLGKQQLKLLRAVGTSYAVLVPCRESRSLCARGLMKSEHEDGAFAHITPDGLRALADAAEAGRIRLWTPKGGKDE